MRNLILLGAKVAESPPKPVPNTGKEPYHIVWNPVAVQSELETYVQPADGDKTGFASKVLSLEPLSDYEPLEFVPAMHSPDAEPLVLDLQPWGVIKYDLPSGGKPPLTIFNVHRFAHADRTGAMPKGFEFRFGSLSHVPELDLFRYNLNADGSRFLAIHAYKGVGDYEVLGKPVACLDGETIIEGDEVFITHAGQGSSSGNLLFIIFSDRLSITNGSVEVSSVYFGERITMTEDAHITFFDESRHYPNSSDTLYMDVLLVYNANW